MTIKGDKNMSEIKDLNAAVDEFTEAIKARLLSKYKQGWRGWDGPPECFSADTRLLKNAAVGIVKKDGKSLIDVAALAMMIWRSLKKR
jgi:hypothetical protein